MINNDIFYSVKETKHKENDPKVIQPILIHVFRP